MKMLIPLLFYQIPEAFMLILGALGLLGLRVRPGRLVLAGLGLGVLTEVSRHFLFNLGLHTPVILVGLTIALALGFRLSISTSITGCFLSFFLLRLGESLLVSPVLSLTKIPLQNALANSWLHVAFGWLSAGFLVLAVIVCNLGGVTLIKAPEAEVSPNQPKG